ncbi:hypothetical protein ACTS9E_15270 [Empedobacter brevis]
MSVRKYCALTDNSDEFLQIVASKTNLDPGYIYGEMRFGNTLLIKLSNGKFDLCCIPNKTDVLVSFSELINNK